MARWKNPDHRARHKAYNDALYVQYQEKYASLKDKPCADCGGRFPACCMDFDHLEEKEFHVTESMRKWDRVLAEAAKCDLICSNCHRIRTKERKQYAKQTSGSCAVQGAV